jgi:hypothetical protein
LQLDKQFARAEEALRNYPKILSTLPRTILNQASFIKEL